MTILGFDSTGKIIRVGVKNRHRLRMLEMPGRSNSHKLLGLAAKLLRGKKPAAIVVCTGPGSYTGTRVGVVVANVLGWSWGISVYGLSRPEATSLAELLEIGEKLLLDGSQSSQAQPRY